ncbi:MAG: cytochrome c oxidase subunit 3 [Bacteroidota bacterium]
MAFHPYNIYLMLTLAGIVVLFIALSASFIYSRVEGNIPVIKLPPIFLFNTLILLGSSATLIWAKRCYLSDHTENYQKALIYTIVLTLIFMIAQFIGWQQLFASNIFINTNNGAAYLYLISGLHFAHVIAGLPFLILFLWTARKRMKEPVSVLVYFSDPEKKLKLRLLTIYWHFLDILWIYLVLFLWINSMIT